MLRLRRYIRARSSYFDRPPDTSERVFVIYNMARYNNRPHYWYTETADMYSSDLFIRSRLPVHTRICYYPMSACPTDGMSEFEALIRRHKVDNFPFLGARAASTVFALDDASEMHDILQKVDAIFRDREDMTV